MKNLKTFSDEVLLQNTKRLVTQEREVTLSVLHHLLEVERRQLFARLGFSSLYEYAVKDLGYSEGSAHRRIAGMRLLRSIPEIEEKIENGSLPLSTLSQAQSFFRQEAVVAPQDKLEVLKKLEGKTSREVERVLVMESAEPTKVVRERIRPLSESTHHLSLTVDGELLKKIEELKSLLSHQNPSMSLSGLLEIVITESLERRKVKEPKVSPPALEMKKPKSTSRYIPIEIERQVWSRDRGECTYVNPDTGRRCGSRHFLEYDHVVPFARGGESSLENLRLRCRTHNRLAAIDAYGAKRVRNFVQVMG